MPDNLDQQKRTAHEKVAVLRSSVGPRGGPAKEVKHLRVSKRHRGEAVFCSKSVICVKVSGIILFLRHFLMLEAARRQAETGRDRQRQAATGRYRPLQAATGRYRTPNTRKYP